MRATYLTATADNTAGKLGDQGQDVRIYRIMVGNPSDGAVIDIFNSSVAYSGQTDNLLAKLTQPTAAAGKDWNTVYDFGPEGLPVDGGNVIQDTNQALTIIWDLAPEG